MITQIARSKIASGVHMEPGAIVANLVVVLVDNIASVPWQHSPSTGASAKQRRLKKVGNVTHRLVPRCVQTEHGECGLCGRLALQVVAVATRRAPGHLLPLRMIAVFPRSVVQMSLPNVC